MLNKSKYKAGLVLAYFFQPQIAQATQDLLDDTQRMMNLFITAVERKRPADADKAMRFLPSLISALVN